MSSIILPNGTRMEVSRTQFQQMRGNLGARTVHGFLLNPSTGKWVPFKKSTAPTVFHKGGVWYVGWSEGTKVPLGDETIKRTLSLSESGNVSSDEGYVS